MAKHNPRITNIEEMPGYNATTRHVVKCRSALMFLNGTTIDIQNPTGGAKEITFKDVSGRLVTTGNLHDISSVGKLEGIEILDTLWHACIKNLFMSSLARAGDLGAQIVFF